MGADHFRDKRIETAHQFASRVVIMRARSLNQSACMRIIHVETASTSSFKTGAGGGRLQFFAKIDNQKVVTAPVFVRS